MKTQAKCFCHNEKAQEDRRQQVSRLSGGPTVQKVTEGVSALWPSTALLACGDMCRAAQSRLCCSLNIHCADSERGGRLCFPIFSVARTFRRAEGGASVFRMRSACHAVGLFALERF